MLIEKYPELTIPLSNKSFIIGCDEVGYGSWAGPLCVGAVRSPKDWSLEGLNDSKKLSPKKRQVMRDKLMELIYKKEIDYYIAERSNQEIDNVGVAIALKESYVESFHTLYTDQCLIICDGILKFDNYAVDAYTMVSMVKADGKIPAVMAASILAKTFRDEKMQKLHELHPQYGWESNVGYGALNHASALKEFGPSPLHRMSYAPMKNMKG